MGLPAETNHALSIPMAQVSGQTRTSTLTPLSSPSQSAPVFAPAALPEAPAVTGL
jgi:hypothetical protein